MKKYILSTAVAIVANCMSVMADNVMTAADVTAEGGKVRVEIGMTNDLEITSWEFKMELPEGFSVALDPDDPDYLFVELATDRTTAKKHNTFDSSILSSGDLYVTCASSTNKTYAVGSSPICYVNLEVASSVVAGEYTIKVKNPVLTNASDNSSIKPGDFTYTITVGSATGIGGIEAGIANRQVYNVSGQRISGMQNGLNIVKKDNGVIQKIIKK